MGRYRARVVVIMVALSVVIAAALLLPRRSTSLFDRATMVATDHDELGQRSGLYWWLSSHQVVLTHSSHDSLQSLVCHDTNAGMDAPCLPLNRLIQAQKAVARIEALSPDRRTLLLWGENGRQIGVAQDGRLLFVDNQTASTPNTEPSFESYMADGSRWVEPIRAWTSHIHSMKEDRIARLLIHDGIRHKIVKTVTFSPWLDQGFPETITTRNHFLMQKRNASGGLGLLLTSNACLQTIDIDLNATTPKPQTLTLKLPLGSEPHDVCYSPDGERVAFLCVLDNHRDGWLPPLLQGWWDRLFPHDTPLPYKVIIWVGDIRGRRIHEVGSVPHDSTFSSDTDGDYPNSLQWLPDGKTLSFLARGAVWTVPAD